MWKNNISFNHSNEREEKHDNDEEFKLNHNFQTKPQLPDICWSHHIKLKLPNIWFSLTQHINHPQQAITILWVVGHNLMRKWLDKIQMTVLFTLGHVMYLMRFVLRHPVWGQNCCANTVKTIQSHQSHFLSLHICKELSVTVVCVFCNELWGWSRQFISWNLDPVCLITAMMV